MMPFERFEASQLCHRLVLEVYRASKTFPAEEKYGLTSQIRRAAFSAASNIAEGSARRADRRNEGEKGEGSFHLLTLPDSA